MDEQDKDYDFQKLRQDVYEYIRNQLQLIKLRLTENISRTLAALIVGVILFGLLSLFFLFISIALTIFIGEITGELYYGFFIMGAFYLILIILLLSFRKSLVERPIIRKLAQIFFEDEEDYE